MIVADFAEAPRQTSSRRTEQVYLGAELAYWRQGGGSRNSGVGSRRSIWRAVALSSDKASVASLPPGRRQHPSLQLGTFFAGDALGLFDRCGPPAPFAKPKERDQFVALNKLQKCAVKICI
jgi:hypothetical protein